MIALCWTAFTAYRISQLHEPLNGQFPSPLPLSGCLLFRRWSGNCVYIHTLVLCQSCQSRSVQCPIRLSITVVLCNNVHTCQSRVRSQLPAWNELKACQCFDQDAVVFFGVKITSASLSQCRQGAQPVSICYCSTIQPSRNTQMRSLQSFKALTTALRCCQHPIDENQMPHNLSWYVMFTQWGDHMTVACGHMTVACDHMTVACDHMTVACDHMTVACGHMTLACDHMTLACDHMTLACDHMTVACDHMTLACDHVTLACESVFTAPRM